MALRRSVGGAKASANLYSLVQTCFANRIDVYQYLVDLFRVLPYAKTVEDYEALLPWKLGKLVPENNRLVKLAEGTCFIDRILYVTTALR